MLVVQVVVFAAARKTCACTQTARLPQRRALANRHPFSTRARVDRNEELNTEGV
jgi:hypothetical protein